MCKGKPVDDRYFGAGTSTSAAILVSNSAIAPRDDDGPACRQGLGVSNRK